MTSPVVLLTGFEPFENDPVNPSWEGVRALDGELIDGARVVARQLPCVFGRAGEALRAALDELDPVLVIGTGLAGGRMEISVERVAINVDDARIADNAGAQPIDRAIAPDGPAAYFSTLPIKRLVAALRAGGVPAAVSQTAGTFVCNHVFYALMHALAARPDAAPGGIPARALAGRTYRSPSRCTDPVARGADARLALGDRRGAQGRRRCAAQRRRAALRRQARRLLTSRFHS